MSVKKSHAKCIGCGGEMYFDPLSQNLLCKNCHSYQMIRKDPSLEKKPYSNDITSFKREKNMCACVNCGAEVEVGDREITKKCPYCNSNFVLENTEINGLIPDLIIPFHFDKTIAKEKYITGVKKRKFLPNKFKKSPNFDSIWGTYLPIFSFDNKTDSIYNGVLEIDETRRDSNGKTYTVTHTKRISGTRHIDFTDVLVEASAMTNQYNLESIKPFNFNDNSTYKYDPDFIRGYNVESYDNDLHACKILSEKITKEKIERIILSGYHYSRVRSFNLSTSFSDYKYAYMLVPVYFIGFEYKTKKYEVYLNGQTGKLGGSLPKSGWKIAFAIIIPILIIASIIIGINLLT